MFESLLTFEMNNTGVYYVKAKYIIKKVRNKSIKSYMMINN